MVVAGRSGTYAATAIVKLRITGFAEVVVAPTAELAPPPDADVDPLAPEAVLVVEVPAVPVDDLLVPAAAVVPVLLRARRRPRLLGRLGLAGGCRSRP